MSVQSVLKFDLKVLNFIGFRWNSKFTWKSFIYSITVSVLFYTIFWMNLFKSKNFLTIPTADAFFFNRLIYFRIAVSFTWHCTYVLCSLFYRKDVRAKLFNEMLKLDQLLNYQQIISKNRQSRVIFKCLTIGGTAFYFIITVSTRFYIQKFSLANLYYNLLIVAQIFILFLINKFVCVLTYLIYSRYEIVLSGNNRFNRRHLINVQLKFQQIVTLFNESFGFIMFMEVTRNFVMLVSFVYFVFENGFKYSGLEYLFVMFIRFLNNFPQIIVLSLLFHYCQKISEKVRNTL